MKTLLPWAIACMLVTGALIEPALPLPNTNAPGMPGVGPAPLLVSVDWLSAHLDDPGLVLFHVGDKADYGTAHIPGAQYVSLQDISTPGGSFPPLELPPLSQLQEFFEKAGVSDGSRIVVYFGKDWISPTARVVLTLHYLGMADRVSILDGGMPAWRTAGKPLTAETKSPKRGTISPKVNRDVVVDLDWVRERLKEPGVALVDARTANYYAGESAGSAKRAGHIPGAVNIPFSSVVDDSMKLKDRGALEALFQQAGVKQGQTVVSYCHIGQQASVIYLVARYLGYEARMYDGSFTEWASKPDLPVEKTP